MLTKTETFVLEVMCCMLYSLTLYMNEHEDGHDECPGCMCMISLQRQMLCRNKSIPNWPLWLIQEAGLDLPHDQTKRRSEYPMLSK